MFSGLAILVAFLGIFGLVAYSIKSRMKEMAIRKVLGAGASAITLLFSKDFIRLILLALVISLPATWYLMQYWLDNFAYRISIGWTSFTWSFLIVLMILLITVTVQTRKTANRNPADILRYE